MSQGYQLVSLNEIPTQSTGGREVIRWFVNMVGSYRTLARGLFLTGFSEIEATLLDVAILDLQAKGVNPLVIKGELLYQQAQHLWQQAVQNSAFGRPAASQTELDLCGADLLVLRDLKEPETAPQLWYLYHHVIYPRALTGKTTLITTSRTYEEFGLAGANCDDFEYAGRKVSWEKLLWTLSATTIDLDHFEKMSEAGLPPMLKAEYELYKALQERNLIAKPQHVVGDYVLDLAIMEDGSERKLDIECQAVSTLNGHNLNAIEAERNRVLFAEGWKILRFSTAEILGDVNACVDAVQEVWQHGRKKSAIGRLLPEQDANTAPDLSIDIDDVQRLAITSGGGPVAIIGGAGTGKSTCIMYRVAYLLNQGINPEKILVLSLTQETTRALRSGVEKLVDRQVAQRVHFYSWHDFGLKILKKNLSAIKRRPPLKIESNPIKVVQRQLAKYKKELDPTVLELSEELDEFTINSLISLYKTNLVTPRYVKECSKTEIEELIAKVYQGYEEQLQKINRIDKDDVINLCAQLLLDHQDIRRNYQYLYDFVLVDEFQDVSAACDVLARVLAFPQDNLYVAGDEDVATNESKGGLPRLLGEIPIKLPNTRCYVLEKNWRSHPAIVNSAHLLASTLKRRRITKEMVSGWGQAPTNAIIGPQALTDEAAEAEWVANEVQILLESGRNAHDIAVLYRYHRYALVIEEALAKKGIRCLASNPEAELVPDEVGDVMSFLKLVTDPDGPKARESFERICQLRVKEIDPKLSATIASFAESNNLSFLKAVEIYSEAVADQPCRDLEQLVRIIRTMHQENLPPAEAISLLKRTLRLQDYYRSIKIPHGVNYEPLRKLNQLVELARQFKTVSEFVKSHTSSKSGSQDGEQDAVHALTIHEAKGQEFLIVFLVGLSEGLFPAEKATDLEEEKRLFYIGVTRAKELLYLSFPSEFNAITLQPSSFLVDAQLIAAPKLTTVTPNKDAVKSSSSASVKQSSEPKLVTRPSSRASESNQVKPVVSLKQDASTQVLPAIKQPAATEPKQSTAVAAQSQPISNPTVISPVALSPATNGTTRIVADQPKSQKVSLPVTPQSGIEQLSPAEVRDKKRNSTEEEFQAEILTPKTRSTKELVVKFRKELAINPSSSTSSMFDELDVAQDREAQLLQLQARSVEQPSSMTQSQAVPKYYFESNREILEKSGTHDIDTQKQNMSPTTFSGPVDEANHCPGCNSVLEAGSRFCGECGYEQEAKIPACNTCGAPLEPSAKFCGECGSKHNIKKPPHRHPADHQIATSLGGFS